MGIAFRDDCIHGDNIHFQNIKMKKMDPQFSVSYSEIVRHAIIAFLAGVAHALNERAGKKESSKWEKVGEFTASALIASFSGVIFGLFALQYFGEGSYLTLALTGSGGFIGAKALKVISESVVEMIRLMILKNSK